MMTPVPAAERLPKLWYNRIPVRIAAILVILGLVAAFLGQAFNITNSSQGRQFHDALGLFSATIPDGWSVTGGAQSDEFYTFQDQHKGDTSANVTIGVTPLNTQSEFATYCVPIRSPARFVDGIPASSFPASMDFYAGTTYDFDSGNAYFRVTVYVVTGLIHFDSTPLPTPTVADPGLVQSQAQAIINSIKVTDHGLC